MDTRAPIDSRDCSDTHLRYAFPMTHLLVFAGLVLVCARRNTRFLILEAPGINESPEILVDEPQ